MIEKKTKKGNAPSCDESLEIQTFKESLEPETLNEFSQVQAMQKLKENIGLILKDSLQVKDNRIGEGDFKEEDGNISPIIMEKKSQLKLQEERIKQAFLENEAAEKETEIKLQTTWENKSTNNNKSCEQQHSQENPVILIESKVESLSQQIVDSLMSTLSLEN